MIHLEQQDKLENKFHNKFRIRKPWRLDPNYRYTPPQSKEVSTAFQSILYASYAQRHPDKLKIIGVVEPDDLRRKHAAKLHNIPERFCFTSVDQLTNGTKIADAVINGTMDRDRVCTSLPLIGDETGI